MSNLYIAVADADETLQFTAVQALENHQVTVYRSWLEGRTPEQVLGEADTPRGWMAVVATAGFLAAIGMLLAWVWLGDWRWGATAAITLAAAVVFLGLSISRGKSATPPRRT